LIKRFWSHFERSEKSSLSVELFLMVKSWSVYIATNYLNSVFYTGITNDLRRRLWEHQQKFVKKSFTSRYRIYKLIWFQEFNNPIEAITIEKKIKDYRRDKKLKLITSLNPNFQDLASLR